MCIRDRWCAYSMSSLCYKHDVRLSVCLSVCNASWLWSYGRTKWKSAHDRIDCLLCWLLAFRIQLWSCDHVIMISSCDHLDYEKCGVLHFSGIQLATYLPCHFIRCYLSILLGFLFSPLNMPAERRLCSAGAFSSFWNYDNLYSPRMVANNRKKYTIYN